MSENGGFNLPLDGDSDSDADQQRPKFDYNSGEVRSNNQIMP